MLLLGLPASVEALLNCSPPTHLPAPASLPPPRPLPPALLPQLTEEETEYKVVCVRHVLERHVVFQFNCTNTVKEQVLEDVSVTMDLSEAEDFSLEAVLPLAVMPQQQPHGEPGGGGGQTYVVLARAEGALALGRFVNVLRFRVKEIDPATGELGLWWCWWWWWWLLWYWSWGCVCVGIPVGREHAAWAGCCCQC